MPTLISPPPIEPRPVVEEGWMEWYLFRLAHPVTVHHLLKSLKSQQNDTCARK